MNLMSTKDVQIRGIGVGEEQRLETEMINVSCPPRNTQTGWEDRCADSTRE